MEFFDIFLFVIALLVSLVGFIGCLIPIVPGPPLSYLALWILQFQSNPPFTTKFLLIWGCITGLVVLLDYYVPIYGTKKMGGSKSGVWGATLGLLIGLVFFGPIGLIFGPFLGALIGELLANKPLRESIKPAFGSFLGFLGGVFIKLLCCGFLIFYLFTSVF